MSYRASISSARSIGGDDFLSKFIGRNQRQASMRRQQAGHVLRLNHLRLCDEVKQNELPLGEITTLGIMVRTGYRDNFQQPNEGSATPTNVVNFQFLKACLRRNFKQCRTQTSSCFQWAYSGRDTEVKKWSFHVVSALFFHDFRLSPISLRGDWKEDLRGMVYPSIPMAARVGTTPWVGTNPPSSRLGSVPSGPVIPDRAGPPRGSVLTVVRLLGVIRLARWSGAPRGCGFGPSERVRNACYA